MRDNLNAKELILSPEAEEEIIATKLFYETRKTGLGCEFVAEVDNVFVRIIENSGQFPVVKRNFIRKATVHRFPFSVFFAENEEVVNILAVFHTSRNPRSISRRM